MLQNFDFIIVGAGSAGAVIAARLSEDPTCRVALIEAGGRPPAEEQIPAAAPLLQLNPQTDWMYAAGASGIPRGDYNGRDRGGSAGVVSLLQTSTRAGKRSSTYHAFLEGETEQRPNLTIITGAHVARVILEGVPGNMMATGVEYRLNTGEGLTVHAAKEVVVCGGAIGSPQLLLLSGIGPAQRARSILPTSAST